MRIGFGYDAHRLVENRKLVLGGVLIPHVKGLLGHSDADVLVHSIIDALIGAMGEGSIGDFFPDTEPKYKDISSIKLLSEIIKVLNNKNYILSNVDSTIVCQDPRIKPHVKSIREKLASILNLEMDRVNIKGKTEEGMGFTGSGEGISSYAVVLIHKKV